jgi:hypothetical protein
VQSCAKGNGCTARFAHVLGLFSSDIENLG